jgi:DNA-binding LytR/AlgR family response regulator
MAKIFIVEDDENQLTTLKIKIASLQHSVIGSSQRAIDALTKIKNTNPDIVLLDINLNGDNDGIILGAEISKVSSAKIIYITALSSNEIIKEAVDTNPIAYLIKPIKITELKIAIDIALNKKEGLRGNTPLNNGEKNILTVRVGNYLYNINFQNIILFDAGGKNYTNLATVENKKYQVRSSLKQLKEKILPDFFIQIHRKCIINVNYINYINEKDQMVYLNNNTSIFIGKTFKKELYEKLNLL